MKTSNFPAAGLCLLLLAACCKDPNPTFIEYPDAEFVLTVTENRQRSHEFIWNYDESTHSLAIDPKEQELQELWVTRWNECTLSADSAAPSFAGVNFESDNPAVVAVEMLDARTCRLTYVSDSGPLPVRISVRTGSRSSQKTFKVYSKDAIELEHVKIRIGEEIVLTPRQAEGNYAQRTVAKLAKVVTDWSDPFQGAEIEIVGLVPENASWRFVKTFQTKYPVRYGYDFNDFSILAAGYEEPFCNGGQESGIDFATIKGRTAWYAPDFGNTGATYFHIPRNCFADDIRTAPVYIYYLLAEFSSGEKQ